MKIPSKEPRPLQERWPAVYQQLETVRNAAEAHFRDVCDLEFIVENGRLYVTQIRLAKQAATARIRSALAFLDEGLITPSEVLCRVTAGNVSEFLRSTILNRDRLKLLGSGVPASAGNATGQVAFDSRGVFRLLQSGIPAILVVTEIHPRDLELISRSEAVVALRGGVSSHSALACREMHKPGVAGYLPKDSTLAAADRPEEIFAQETWITVDGGTGDVFSGRGRYS